MLGLIFWSMVALGAAGGIVYLILRTKWRAKPQIPILKAIAAAKLALKNKEEWPKLYFFHPDTHAEELIAYDALTKEHLQRQGFYRMRWPHLDLKYTIKQQSEEVRLKLEGQDKAVTLLYLDGELGSMALGTDIFGKEDFEMRHAGNLADQLRKVLRHQLCGGYGTHKHKKKRETDTSSEFELNDAGEIKVKGGLPNAQDYAS
ncbi:MAG TPA: hypothetical protein PLN21_05755 [Gemmatales bacterium]|nr:hypothetical protein [Gemmatales bacterium]